MPLSTCVAPQVRLTTQRLMTVLVDLPEVRKLAGVLHCPDCQPDPDDPAEDATTPRTTEVTLRCIAEAIDCLVCGGTLKQVRGILASYGLARTHLEASNPFLALHLFCLSCFPGDRLHLAYAPACVRVCVCGRLLGYVCFHARVLHDVWVCVRGEVC